MKQICNNLAGFPDQESQLLLLLYQRLVRRRLPRCHWRKIIDYFTWGVICTIIIIAYNIMITIVELSMAIMFIKNYARQTKKKYDSSVCIVATNNMFASFSSYDIIWSSYDQIITSFSWNDDPQILEPSPSQLVVSTESALFVNESLFTFSACFLRAAMERRRGKI